MTEYEHSVEVSLEKESDSNRFHLTVFTTDGTGSALSGVSVSLSGPSSRSGTTENAAVRFTDIEPGNYTVTAAKDGYKDGQASVTVDTSP